MARDLSDEEVTLCAGIYPQARWAGGTLTEQGSAYRVAISAADAAGERVAIRFGRAPEAADALARMARLHPLLTEPLGRAGIAVPLPLGPVQPSALGPAMAFSFLAGGPHPHYRANPGEFAAGGDDPAVTVPALVDLLAAFGRVELNSVRPELAPPYSYRGPWTDTKVATVLGFVAEHAPTLVAPASRIVRGVRERPEGFGGTVGLVHGDLAGQNMRWNADFTAVTGLLDWDLASAWDPAINLMQLSLWHGPTLVPAVAGALEETGVLSGAGVDTASAFADRVTYWSGVWALENLWHAADRQLQASAVVGVKPIKSGALRRLFAKLGPRVVDAAAALNRLLGGTPQVF